ncbi:MAG: class I poly(R)-hydroxyalkanoic acid synthase, partial [Chloroflexi bacterium]|nr:class I poly(R)-hydroxyalkanoic acid synthase [Chloroflexota bacterium]
IRQDLYVVGAEQDHIVPWQGAWQISRLANGKTRYVLAASGHIAGVISPPSKGRGYWVNEKRAASPEAWLNRAERRDGSWWSDWLEWLRPRSGKQVAPPALGSSAHPPIAPAPGTYVLEK